MGECNRQLAASPQAKPTDMGVESACRLLPSTPTITIINVTQTKADSHFTVPWRVGGWVELFGWIEWVTRQNFYVKRGWVIAWLILFMCACVCLCVVIRLESQWILWLADSAPIRARSTLCDQVQRTLLYPPSFCCSMLCLSVYSFVHKLTQQVVYGLGELSVVSPEQNGYILNTWERVFQRGKIFS